MSTYFRLGFRERIPIIVEVAESIALVPSILLVESNDEHALLVKAVFAELDQTVLLYRVADVDQALEFLFRSDKYKMARAPNLVLLNREMPRRSGYHVLDAIYADASLTHIPVVVFSADDTFRDKANSLSHGAFAHIGKPRDYRGYREVLREIIKILPQKRMAAAC
jgi:two-component system, chemotaxis family, response regulator Rcp1